MSIKSHSARATLAAVVVWLTACVDSSGLGSNSEIRNNPDNFVFFASQLEKESGTHEYLWAMSGSTGKINQLSVLSGGEAQVAIFDHAGVEVFSKDLSSGGTFPTTAGQAGTWKVRVTLSRATGTVHFVLTNPATVSSRPAGVGY